MLDTVPVSINAKPLLNSQIRYEGKRALRQRAFQGGVTEEELLVTGCMTPPWKVQSLAKISFG